MDPLLRQAQAGSESACAELMERFGKDVRAYLGRHVGRGLARKVSSADLCQETFVRVFRSLRDLPEDADLALFKGRLMRHAEWVIRDAARSLRHLVGESVAGEDPTEAVPARIPASSMGDTTRHDETAWLGRLIDKLDPSYAEVIRARLAGESFAVIAERRGENEATVRKRYERAYHRLQDVVGLAAEAREQGHA